MKNAFSREIPQRFSRYKKGKCGKPSGGKIQKSGMGIAMQQLECRFYPR